MSWLVVARKDFADSIRSRWLLGLTALFVLLVALVAYLLRPAPGEVASANSVLGTLGNLFVGTLIPLIALVVAYSAVTGERDTGSLKLLLSLPHSRADVVFGKVLGRSAALATAILVGFVLPAIVLAIGPFTLEIGSYLGYTLLVVLLAAAFVAIAVGWSAAAPSQRIALAGAIGLYFLFVPFWGAIRFPLQFALTSLPGWVPLDAGTISTALVLLNPRAAFGELSSVVLDGALLTGGDVEFQLAAIGMLVFWLLAPPLVGLFFFERRDL